jgi:hypothetical protein
MSCSPVFCIWNVQSWVEGANDDTDSNTDWYCTHRRELPWHCEGHSASSEDVLVELGRSRTLWNRSLHRRKLPEHSPYINPFAYRIQGLVAFHETLKSKSTQTFHFIRCYDRIQDGKYVVQVIRPLVYNMEGNRCNWSYNVELPTRVI